MTTPAAPPPIGSSPPNYGPPLTLATARIVMAAAEAEANRLGWPVVIAILDSGGVLCLLQRLDQANVHAVTIAQRKASCAVGFRRATKAFEDVLSTPGGMRMLMLGPEMVAVEGGLPLFVNGEVVGGIGVSGMNSSQDGIIAAAGARALTPGP